MKLKFLNGANMLNTKESGGIKPQRNKCKSGNYIYVCVRYQRRFWNCMRETGKGRWDEGAWKKSEDQRKEGMKQKEKEAAKGRRAVVIFSLPAPDCSCPPCWMINVLLTRWNKVLQINGCFREISSLVQLSVHSGAVSTGSYYAVNQRTKTYKEKVCA